MKKTPAPLVCLCVSYFLRRFGQRFLIEHQNQIGIVEKVYGLFIKKILALIREHHGDIYGGFVRDMIADRMFNDIDVRFSRDTDIAVFITNLEKNGFAITCLSQSYNKCQTIRVTDRVTSLSVKLDLSFWLKSISSTIGFYDNHRHQYQCINGSYYKRMHENEHIDFDVNTLVWSSSKHNPHHRDQWYLPMDVRNQHEISFLTERTSCSFESVIENCKLRQFIVLDADHKPSRVHINRHYRLFTPASYKFDRCYCIMRDSLEGQKILKRIEKMKSRGWTMLNGPCQNPRCIMAPEKIAIKFQQEQAREMRVTLKLLEKKNKIKEIKMNIQSLPTPEPMKMSNEESYQRRYQAKTIYTEKRALVKARKQQTNLRSRSKRSRNFHDFD